MSHSSKWVWYMEAEAKKIFAMDKQSLGTRNVHLIWEWPINHELWYIREPISRIRWDMKNNESSTESDWNDIK